MSAKNRTRLEVQKILRRVILDGLAYAGYQEKTSTLDGWECVEYGNSSIQSMDRVVLMNLLGSERLGWQEVNYDQIDSNFKRKDGWNEEQSWQLHIICKRKNGIEMPEDVASNLVTWFNGPGCGELRKKGCASSRIDSDSVIVYNDNSDLYQKRVVFTVKIQVLKELTMAEVEADAVKPKTMPV